jgi:hypothetical protein
MTKIVAVPQGLKLKKYTIPDSVTCIGAYAFCNNSSLQSIVIPDKVTELGNNAFYSCRALINIVLGTGITSIPQGAFMGCIELQKVTINGSLISVGEDAFYDCSSLEVINLPDTLQTIEKNAFFDCSNLKKITLPANIVKIEDYSIGYFEEGKGDDICIKGVYGTQAQLYAEKLGFAFENAETGEVIYYNLKKMEKEEIVSVTSLKKKQISLLYLEMYGAKYQIRIRVKGTSAWKQYTASHAGETIKKLKSGKTYQVKVRAYGNVEGTAYYSKWSSVKKVKVK